MKRLLTFAFALAFSASAAAQYPAKPVRIVVPFPGGSATDTITRILAQSISPGFGQTMIVDNKPGADGAIAAAEVAKAPPDGYTLLMATNSPMSAVPAMKKSPPYDQSRISPRSPTSGAIRSSLYVNSSVQAKTFRTWSPMQGEPRQAGLCDRQHTGSSRLR
jgi:tripartite-type tricarboxylate transporter receptor subunit TctC